MTVYLRTGRRSIYDIPRPKKCRWHRRKRKKPVGHVEHLRESRRATKYVALAGFGKDRYCIINKAGNVVDDGGGHGFKSKKKAMKSHIWQKCQHIKLSDVLLGMKSHDEIF